MRIRIIAAGLATLLLAAGCTQQGVVKGQQSGPGWQMTGSTSTTMTSNVEYLGASADGLIIVRTSDGKAQVWKPAP